MPKHTLRYLWISVAALSYASLIDACAKVAKSLFIIFKFMLDLALVSQFSAVVLRTFKPALSLLFT
jgi:hypothetical protein